MGFINQDIKNLVSGISQQPAILRHPEQLETQVNGFSTEASGLRKRPPTLFVKNTNMSIGANDYPYVHFINRDETEKYCVVLTNNTVYVYDLDGNAKSVIIQEDSSYLTAALPRSTFKCLTIADYTFILNTTKKAVMTNSKTTNVWATQGLLVAIKSGQYGRTYSITVNGSTVASYTTPDGSSSSHVNNIDTNYIASQLASSAQGAGWSVTTGASWLYLTKTGVTISTFVVKDGYNNQAAYGFHKTTQKFSNLPASAPDGFTVKVIGEAGSDTDDHYIKYVASEQVWKETVCPDIEYQYDMTVMPHVLVRNANGTFTFKRGDWSDRDIGDDSSNPVPSFIDQNIHDIFYHKNRLGLLAGENVILSRSADFFNFWVQSATKVQDTDPIDLAASDATISTLYNAVPYDDELILFSREAQFSLRSNSVLTPKDAVLTPAITHYEASIKAKPVNAGRNIYFPAERAVYTTMREFFTATDNTEAKDVQDISSHVPNYIPNGVYKLLASTVENVLLILTEQDEKNIFIYKYLFVDGQRIQAAWSVWNMGDRVVGGAFVDNWLYLLVVRNGYACIEKISFSLNMIDYVKEPYRVLLDSKISQTVASGLYDPLYDETTINVSTYLGTLYQSSRTYGVVTEDGVYKETGTNGTVTLIGDYTNKKIFIGIPYTFKIVMSPVMVKTASETGGTSAMTEGRLQLRQMWFNYDTSGYFKVNVVHKDKNTYTYEHTARALGDDENVLGSMPLTKGSFRFPVMGNSMNCSISLESDKPLPIALVGAGWNGNYQRKSRLV